MSIALVVTLQLQNFIWKPNLMDCRSHLLSLGYMECLERKGVSVIDVAELFLLFTKLVLAAICR